MFWIGQFCLDIRAGFPIDTPQRLLEARLFFLWEWVHVQSPNWIKTDELPSGYVKIAIENDHL